jgi:NIMA (never in mitosis gene a)-related kinase
LAGMISKKRAERAPFDEELIKKWLIQICVGLQYIHSKHILHRDMKPQNVLLGKNMTAKIADFGISAALASTQEMKKTAQGTPYYTAPEIWRGIDYNREVDMWSLGCMIYELCTLQASADEKP